MAAETTPASCTHEGCERPARMAVSVHRPARDNIYLKVFTDDRSAPAKAVRYCNEHGTKAVPELLRVLVDQDDDAPAASA